jgi:hypothetical protein
MQSEFITVEAEMAYLRSVIKETVMRRDRLKDAMERWYASVDSSAGPARIFLMQFTSIDPPFDCAEKINAQFIDLTEARGLSGVELELLRQAYEYVMTG